MKLLLFLSFSLGFSFYVLEDFEPRHPFYVRFVTEWGPGACEVYDKLNCSRMFTIHGVWPEFIHGYPSFCEYTQFNKTEITPLVSNLTKYWPSYIGSNERFWKHEYLKHGTCMKLTEFRYFSFSLGLYTHMILNRFEAINMTSKNIKQYIRDYWDLDSHLSCTENNILFELDICLGVENCGRRKLGYRERECYDGVNILK